MKPGPFPYTTYDKDGNPVMDTKGIARGQYDPRKMYSGDEEPAYVLQRHPYKPGETLIKIWVKEDSMQASSSEIADLLGSVLQSQIKAKK